MYQKSRPLYVRAPAARGFLRSAFDRWKPFDARYSVLVPVWVTEVRDDYIEVKPFFGSRLQVPGRVLACYPAGCEAGP